MSSKRCYYEVLGVSRTATVEEVKKAYKKIALANHPDRNPGDEEAIQRFKDAAEAYEVLSNPQKRAGYDRYGHAGVSGAGRAGFNEVSDIFDLFGDIFDGFGFGGARRGGATRARQGDSLRTSLTIDLLEAARGCSRTIEIERLEQCTTCGGSGAKPGSAPETCDYCRGHGQVVQSQGFFRLQTTCPRCQGTGTIVRDKCGSCQGRGRIPAPVTLDVRIPPGVDTGMQLCLRGEGAAGTNGGPRGDLYVDIQVREHPLFQRKGPHLTCRVPITYTQAALGAEIEIPVLEGRHTYTIPAGTQPGEVFRLRGAGMPDPHGGRPGDLHVEVQLEVPKQVGGRHEELLRELAELENANVGAHRKTFLEKLKDWFSLNDDAT